MINFETMKKSYIKPCATAVSLYTGEDVMLALSLTSEKANGTSALSNEKGGWDSSDWTDVDTEE